MAITLQCQFSLLLLLAVSGFFVDPLDPRSIIFTPRPVGPTCNAEALPVFAQKYLLSFFSKSHGSLGDSGPLIHEQFLFILEGSVGRMVGWWDSLMVRRSDGWMVGFEKKYIKIKKIETKGGSMSNLSYMNPMTNSKLLILWHL